MRSAIRKPKIRKPMKGMRTHIHQGLRAYKKAMAIIESKAKAAPKQRWLTPRAMRALWLMSFGFNKPHQSHAEKARRMRQMREHKCINPEVWV